MKNIFLFMLVLAPGSLFAQSKKGFTISGKIDGINDGVFVKLGNFYADWHRPAWMDSGVIKNGQFHFSVDEIPGAPRQYVICFFKVVNGSTSDHMIETDQRKDEGAGLEFFADNGDDIKVSGNKNQWKKITITGSAATEARNWSTPLAVHVLDWKSDVNRRLRKIRDSIGYDSKLVEEQVLLKAKIDHYLDSAIKSQLPAKQVGIPNLLVTLHDFWGGYHGSFQKELFASLPSNIQNSYEGKIAMNYAQLSVGYPIPDFTLSTPEGKKINLKAFAAKNKITLVHFWGPDCVDRDKMQREVRAMYDKYHDKGLNVIAVSADTARDNWEIAVRIKKYPWTNVLAEPGGWRESGMVNDIYGEGGHWVPNTTNVLIDSKGIILAWDVLGAELQYYLEKYLNKISKN